jgi:alpha/beta superfamily hydrolase
MAVYKQILILFALFSLRPQAGAVEILVSQPSGETRGLVVIAPAKKYLMHERLFETLANALTKEGYVAFRFNWSKDTLRDPHLEMQRASSDMLEAIKIAQQRTGFHANRTVLISKSFSTKVIHPSLIYAQTHILLTPNCSAEAPFQKVYSEVLSFAGLRVKIYLSEKDPYCDVDHVRQALRHMSKSSALVVTQGDHNFVEMKGEFKKSFQPQDDVIRSITKEVRSL